MSVTINHEFFQTGLTWDDYVTNEAIRNKDRLLATFNEARPIAEVAPEKDAIARIAPHWLVIAEDWCSDSVRAVPVIAQLAARSGAKFRIWPRDKNPELMDQYLTDGKRKIPILVLYDADFNEVSRWVERPKGAPTQMAKLQQALESQNVPITAPSILQVTADICNLIYLYRLAYDE